MLLNYPNLVNKVITCGEVVESRLGPTRELIAEQVKFTPYELVYRPRINKALGWMELIQLLAGTFSPKDIQRVAPSAKMEYFDGVSAYGPRIYNAVPEVNPTIGHLDSTFEHLQITPSKYDTDYVQRILREVRDNPGTRRAVLFIGKSWDSPKGLSCTMTYQFLSRRGKLYGVVGMRSWDVIRGLPYDIVMFGGLLQAAARVLRLEPGYVWVNAGSLHLYESDIELVPTERRVAKYTLDLHPEALWSGVKMMCLNQVGQPWEAGPTKAPYFIKVTPWQLL